MNYKNIPRDLEVPITENRIEKRPTGSFLLRLLFRQVVQKFHNLFGPHCNTSAYSTLNIMS